MVSLLAAFPYTWYMYHLAFERSQQNACKTAKKLHNEKKNLPQFDLNIEIYIHYC